MHCHRLTGAVIAGSFLLAGCATSNAATQSSAVATRAPAGPSSSSPSPAPSSGAMSPGMVMPDGSVMDGGPAGPSASARMICGTEARGDIAKILALTSLPAPAAHWADRLYTCTYRLPQGPLVISVKESADAAATRAYVSAERRRLGAAHDLAGLTAGAFGTATGTVALTKDSNTLTVDATGLPAEFGPAHQKRSDLAYEVASVILGCWTGN